MNKLVRLKNERGDYGYNIPNGWEKYHPCMGYARMYVQQCTGSYPVCYIVEKEGNR